MSRTNPEQAEKLHSALVPHAGTDPKVRRDVVRLGALGDDTDDHVRLDGHPGAFREMLGIVTEDFFPLGAVDGVVHVAAGGCAVVRERRPS